MDARSFPDDRCKIFNPARCFRFITQWLRVEQKKYSPAPDCRQFDSCLVTCTITGGGFIHPSGTYGDDADTRSFPQWIDSRGYITYPLIGQVRAKGLKPAQLERVIAQKLEQTYMNNPQVTVVVKESVQNRVTVEGAVNKPGVFPVSGRMTVLQAIALAGGLDARADVHSAVLLRRNANGQISQQPIDIAAIRQGRMQDLMLIQDDRIVVQEATYNRFTVDGSVAKPGVFQLQPGMTFMQAIAMAGGITELTDKTNATLFRRDRHGQFRRYAVNLEAIREGRAPDPLLERDDRIVMSEDGKKTFLRDASRFISPIKLF